MRRLIATTAMTAALLMPVSAPSVQAAGLAVKFTSFRSPVRLGHKAAATVHSGPDVRCKLKMVINGATSTVGAKYTNSSGNVSWSWIIPSSTQTGIWPVTVTCRTSQSGSKSGKATKHLTVTA